MSKKGVLFLTLKIFSATGGIEKVCRIVGKLLWEEVEKGNIGLDIYAMHDQIALCDEKYFSNDVYKVFNSNKMAFGLRSIWAGISSRIVILSHLNIIVFGYIIKLLHPSAKLMLFAHGIEVWKRLSWIQAKGLKKCDTVICVSNFTREKMISLHGVDRHRCLVLNNCLDPYLPEAKNDDKSLELLTKYSLKQDNIVLLTLSRLSAHDRDKGYEKVLKAVNVLKEEFPMLVYMIAGKYDDAEKKWLDNLIDQLELKNRVVFTGYVQDDQLAAHFGLSDIYVMPSRKEGFGIIFIEAMHYGKPVIAGNKDGSVDALANGKFGLLVNPDDQIAVTNALREMIVNKQLYIPNHQLVKEYFGYKKYKSKLLQILNLN